MLKLFIMRHADSHVNDHSGDDFSREITKKGIINKQIKFIESTKSQ